MMNTAAAMPRESGVILDGEAVPDDILELVRQNLRNRIEAQHAIARAQQLAAAEFHAKARSDEACTIDGMGQCVARISPAAYFYWVNRLGADCWQDSAFRHEFLRDNPAARVKYKPRTATIVKP